MLFLAFSILKESAGLRQTKTKATNPPLTQLLSLKPYKKTNVGK